MKPCFTLTKIIVLSYFLTLVLGLSCSGKFDREGLAAEAQLSSDAKEIVIINTSSAKGIQGETMAARRLFLVKPSEISPAEQLSRLLAVQGADTRVKAIVVSPAIRGTASAFASLREKRPDLLLYAIDSEEDYLEIEESATFVVSTDQEAVAYSAVWAAARLGCTRFVYVASRPPQPDGEAGHRQAVLAKAAAEFGLDFADASLVSNEALPLVIGMKSAGSKTAFYLAGESVIEPMLAAIVQEGGIVAGMYPGSFLMEHPELAGAAPPVADPASVLASLEKAIGLQGGSGRLVLPGYPEGAALEAAVILSLQQSIQNKTGKPDSAQFHVFLRQVTSNISWRVDYSMDRQTGVRSRNHLLVFQDLYLIGRGYLPFTKGTIPDGYRR